MIHKRPAATPRRQAAPKSESGCNPKEKGERSFASPSKKNRGISWRCVAISTRHLRLGQAVLPVPGPMHEKLKHYADKIFCVTMGVPPRIKLYQQNGHTTTLHCVYLIGADLHKLERIMQTKFLGQGSGRAVANQTIGKREHRLTSLICLYIGERYLRPNLPDRNRANRVKRRPCPILNYGRVISLNEEGNFRFMAATTSALLGARANKVNVNFTVHSNPPVLMLFLLILSPIDFRRCRNLVAYFFSRQRIIPGWSFK
ncbi:hypothetical protein ALC62_04451 [Cyphomyrmex costatus]|uniref:Uncharacterized protein n=1 Tax=Cyphomyrmex costatus TaxID=456900 RepID=A0A151IK80_9HYME|nr:hypothetical protein ALC62_04451 [Cyphomyrmex costatus]